MIDHKHAEMMLRLARRDFDSLEVMKRSQQVDDAIFGFHAQQSR
jgi:hypothetical protein